MSMVTFICTSAEHELILLRLLYGASFPMSEEAQSSDFVLPVSLHACTYTDENVILTDSE